MRHGLTASFQESLARDSEPPANKDEEESCQDEVQGTFEDSEAFGAENGDEELVEGLWGGGGGREVCIVFTVEVVTGGGGSDAVLRSKFFETGLFVLGEGGRALGTAL